MKCFKHLSSSMVIFLALAVSAQPGAGIYKNPKKLQVYARIYSSYGFLTPGSFKGTSYLWGAEPLSFNVAKNAMGNGIYYGAGLGIIFNEFWNVGITGEYLSGNKIKIEHNITAQESTDFHASGYSFEASRIYDYSIASIIPNIVFKTISKPSYYIYTRLGLRIGIPLKMTESYNLHYQLMEKVTNGPTSVKQRNTNQATIWEHTFKAGVGYQFSAGIQFVLSKNLRGFFEISANGNSYSRKKSEETSNENTMILQRVDGTTTTTVDHSKLTIYYIKDGVPSITQTGQQFNYTYTAQSLQDPVHVNSINAGIGLTYIF